MFDVRHQRLTEYEGKRKKQPFSISKYLATTGPGSSALNFQAGQAIFCQGDAADALYYIRRGTVKLTAVSKAGREAVIGLLKAGDFFGEECLVDKPKHITTASVMSSTSLLVSAIGSDGRRWGYCWRARIFLVSWLKTQSHTFGSQVHLGNRRH
jgi:signal-transduction protein with cAMP-binding, CBS, and nucleotidyltransferase domain